MFKIRIVILGWVAVIAAMTTFVSAASAVISFQYNVNGSKLAAGSSKEFISRRDGTAVLTGTIAGTKAELLSTKGKVASGAKIFGGVPGTSEEVLELESVVVDKPAKCAVAGERITTSPVKGEIVEGASSGKGDGEVDVLITPRTGTTFTTVEFVNKGTEECILKGQKPAVTGSKLGLALPQRAETVRGAGDEEASTKEYKNSAGAFRTVGLTFAGEPATVTGLVLVELVSGEKAGLF